LPALLTYTGGATTVVMEDIGSAMAPPNATFPAEVVGGDTPDITVGRLNRLAELIVAAWLSLATAAPT